MGAERKIYTVGELTRRIKAAIEGSVGEVWLEGEVSNVRRPGSGHVYFTLKDEMAQIAAVLFRGAQRGAALQPADGMKVRVLGDVTVYEKGGNYQIIVRRIEDAGKGDLRARFEALKEKLKAEGLFDAQRKRPLPLLPRHVGIATSDSGAAIRDILKVLDRRFPNLHVAVAPCRVQGEGAAEEIAAALDLLNERGGFDVLVVGRGGGSAEDLWCFNEEAVARAIARSRIPVISAVGHETDFTISDFVADVRAPTPSAAAEMLVQSKETFLGRLDEAAGALRRAAREAALRARNRLLRAEGSRVFQEPRAAARVFAQRIETLGARMGHGMRERLQSGQQRLDEAGLRMAHAFERRHADRRQQLRRLLTQLEALSPLSVLRRGYSVTSDESGRTVTAFTDVKEGQKLATRLFRGSVESEVTATRGP
jgi:exodeoxyribonuclease VII large subunit